MDQLQIESIDPVASTVTFSLDHELYPRDALYAAAYVFLDRAYVLLDRAGDRYLVHLRAKQALPEAELRAFGGELANELLAQTLRHRVVKANQSLIEQITALAITGAVGARSRAGEIAGDTSSDVGSSEETAAAEFLDDPLGLGTPWQDKKDPV
ncbi:MAG TPA: His-Xaa-Ser system protein HxsD [Terriglobales bacterium]|nr:His-Xaa-Ser system protein HxsD [Terriglobales bacterium]